MFSVTIYPVYFRFLLCYNDKDERQKYGVIEDSNKKAERCYSPGSILYMYSSFDNNSEIFVRKEIYAPELFIVRVRTILLWRGACLYMGGISGVNSCEGIIYHCEVYNSELEGSMPVAENSGDDNYGCVGGICAINEGNISYCSTADCILDLDVYGDGYEKLFDLNKAYPHAIVGGIVAEHDSDVRLSQCLSSGNSIKMYASKGGYTEPTTIGGTIIGVLKTGELHECYAKVSQTITITTTKDGPVIVDHMIGRGDSSGCKSFSDESELPDYFNDLLPNETDN